MKYLLLLLFTVVCMSIQPSPVSAEAWYKGLIPGSSSKSKKEYKPVITGGGANSAKYKNRQRKKKLIGDELNLDKKIRVNSGPYKGRVMTIRQYQAVNRKISKRNFILANAGSFKKAKKKEALIRQKTLKEGQRLAKYADALAKERNKKMALEMEALEEEGKRKLEYSFD